MYGNAPTKLHSTRAICEGKKHVSDQCNPIVEKTIIGTGSASTANNYEPSIDIQPTTTLADSQNKRQSLFLSQEASSIFDKALEMHAAPTDDPPMWGDNFEDLREVADMLEDIDDFSTGNDAVGQRSCYDPPNFKAASKRGSLGCFLNDAGASTHDSLDAKPNGEESKPGNNDLKIGISGSNSAAENDERDLPLHIMNMDKRIFEDNMFLGDIAQGESDSISDTFFYNRGIFDNSVPYVLNSKLGPPENPVHVENSPDLKAASRVLLIRKEADLESKCNQLQRTYAVVVKQETPMVAPQAKFSPEYLKDSMQDTHDCSDREETAMAKHEECKDQRVSCPKETTKSDAAWKRRFLELEDFKRQHGHCNVHQKYGKNPSLGAWVARQRLIMRHWEDKPDEKIHNTSRRSLPTAERIKQLKNIGLEPSIGKGAFGKICSRNTNEWEKQFSDLIRYRDIHGDCNVPTKSTSLGRWVASQRKKHRQFLADEGRVEDQVFAWGKELRNRFQRLKDIGFNFYVGKGNAQQKRSNSRETPK